MSRLDLETHLKFKNQQDSLNNMFFSYFPFLLVILGPTQSPQVKPLKNHLTDRFAVNVDIQSPIKTRNSPQGMRKVRGKLTWKTPTPSSQWIVRLVAESAKGDNEPPDVLKVNGDAMGTEAVIQLHKDATQLKFQFEAHGQPDDHLDKVTAYLCDGPATVRGAGQRVVVVSSISAAGLKIFQDDPKDGGYIPITQVKPPTQGGSTTTTLVSGSFTGNRTLVSGETAQVAVIFGGTSFAVLNGCRDYGTNTTSGFGWKAVIATTTMSTVQTKTLVSWNANLGSQPPNRIIGIVCLIKKNGVITERGRLTPVGL